jgi:hypothetical protein
VAAIFDESIIPIGPEVTQRYNRQVPGYEQRSVCCLGLPTFDITHDLHSQSFARLVNISSSPQTTLGYDLVSEISIVTVLSDNLSHGK